MRSFRAASALLLAALALSTSAAPKLVPIGNTSSLVAAKSSSPSNFLSLGSLVLFTANDGIHGQELWRSDGTAAGTALVKDIAPGATGSSLRLIAVVGGAVIFTVGDAQSVGIWRSDGTADGTIPLASIPYSSANLANGFYVITAADASRAYFLVQQKYGSAIDLWASDGTAAGTRLVGTYPLSLNPPPVVAAGKLFVVGNESALGPQLWVSDGTVAGTHMVRRGVECPGVLCGLAPQALYNVGNTALLVTPDAIWASDGTGPGTVQLAAMDKPQLITASASIAYVRNGDSMWRTDGTSAGTRRVAPYEDLGLVRVLGDGRLFYARAPSGGALYDVFVTDSNGANPTKIGSLPMSSGDGGGLGRFVAIAGSRVFLATGTADVGTELWLIDIDAGTSALVKDLDPRQDYLKVYSGTPGPGIVLGSSILFPATNAFGRELWQSDGTAGGTKLLANIAADGDGGMISGTVRDAASGAPVAGANVNLCTTTCTDFAYTDKGGRYRFEGVIPGTYVLGSASSTHLGQYYDGFNCPCPNGLATGTPVAVVAGMETTGIDFALALGGTISGMVTRASTGKPMDFVDMVVRDSSGIVRSQSSTYLGKYTLWGLPSGTYSVETLYRSAYGQEGPAVDQVYRNHNCPVSGCDWRAGDPVAVTSGKETASIDFALHDYGTISGTVRDSSDQRPIANLEVTFVAPTHGTSTARTDAAGKYTSPALRPGSYYVKIVGGGPFNGIVYPDAPCTTFDCDPTVGKPVVLDVDASVTGIDFNLRPRKGRITGIVRDRNGAPLNGIDVMLRDGKGYYISAYGGPSTTAADGRFTFNDLPTGGYYVAAWDEVYPNVDCPSNGCDVTAATPINVTEGKTTDMPDMQLRSQRTTVSGRVTDAVTGQPPSASGSVSLVLPSGNSVASSSYGSDGKYSVTVIRRDTSFYARALAGTYHTVVYPNIRADCDPYSTCPVPSNAALVTSGATNVDFQLPPYGAITGTVVDGATGKPVKAVVQFQTTSGKQGNTFTDDSGKYRWQAADGSKYYVWAMSYGSSKYAGQVYRDHDCAAACDPKTGDLVTAPDGVDTAGIDFHLKAVIPTATISGRVVDAESGQPIANAYVSAHNPSGYDVAARTDAQGYYTISGEDEYRGVVSGDYRMYVEPPRPWFVTLSGGATCADFYACDLRGGAPVTVKAPAPATGVDFRVPRLSIHSIAPAEGPASGGTRVVVTGANFPPKATLKIGGTDATIVSVTPTEIQALTPIAANTGAAHVTVVASPNLSVTFTHGFMYTASETTISDAAGALTGGTKPVKPPKPKPRH